MTVDTNTHKQPCLLSVGIAAMDFFATVPHFPEPDGKKMQSTQLLCEGGGNAANTACAMARLFDNDDVLDDDDDVVNIVTAVGQDANGDTIINGLKENMSMSTMSNAIWDPVPFRTFCAPTWTEKVRAPLFTNLPTAICRLSFVIIFQYKTTRLCILMCNTTSRPISGKEMCVTQHSLLGRRGTTSRRTARIAGRGERRDLQFQLCQSHTQ